MEEGRGGRSRGVPIMTTSKSARRSPELRAMALVRRLPQKTHLILLVAGGLPQPPSRLGSSVGSRSKSPFVSMSTLAGKRGEACRC